MSDVQLFRNFEWTVRNPGFAGSRLPLNCEFPQLQHGVREFKQPKESIGCPRLNRRSYFLSVQRCYSQPTHSGKFGLRHNVLFSDFPHSFGVENPEMFTGRTVDQPFTIVMQEIQCAAFKTAHWNHCAQFRRATFRPIFKSVLELRW